MDNDQWIGPIVDETAPRTDLPPVVIVFPGAGSTGSRPAVIGSPGGGRAGHG